MGAEDKILWQNEKELVLNPESLVHVRFADVFVRLEVLD